MKNNIDGEVLEKLSDIGYIDKQKKLAFNNGKKHAHNSLTDDLKEITSALSTEYN